MELTRTWRPPYALDLRLTLGQLQRGKSDPTYRVAADGAVWRSALTPDGPCTLRVSARRGTGEVTGRAWGPGAAWQLDRFPELLGSGDDPDGFPAHRHPLLHDEFRRRPGLRMPRTGLVMAALIPSVLEQKVTTIEARRAFRMLVHRHGTPAPGPAPDDLRVIPDTAGWARIPTWDWHQAGVDHKRSRTLMEALRVAGALERTARQPNAEASRLLKLVPGIGVWTTAETMQRSHGDADALSVGDLHLCGQVAHALTGAPGDDARMLELLEPFRGHRHRAALLIRMSGVRVPRRAPRFAPRDFSRI
ncbi:DNA-3-methyladenine glycosylase 2 family protein [Yinghuangia sp. ASG 101]|uniref:DNA-3-methyladenine glycosylase family protein n=1 Tax=Yinghuangia sp. ASG 101 TaxID=2896848 RepID=UPI001E54CAB3|nr:DNA-3-methyladenine glycosylase 2 family protein [Yinghuangia sp. ASG 101]UGQ09533.1 DNA-3-methyladenine glycosylase 2 family protein [Yinghuangia sp. ASG 101]